MYETYLLCENSLASLAPLRLEQQVRTPLTPRVTPLFVRSGVWFGLTTHKKSFSVPPSNDNVALPVTEIYIELLINLSDLESIRKNIFKIQFVSLIERELNLRTRSTTIHQPYLIGMDQSSLREVPCPVKLHVWYFILKIPLGNYFFIVAVFPGWSRQKRRDSQKNKSNQFPDWLIIKCFVS